jgi:uncharacterized membrane protein YdjX (TVP38/TMEM64 family)
MDHNFNFNNSRHKATLIIATIIFVAIIACMVYFGWPIISKMNSPMELREFIEGYGAWGPIIFILLQILQVMIAPIPGQAIGLIGGILFGPYLGLLYTLIGSTIGFTIVLSLSRKLGRPFVEHFISRKTLDKFDNLTREKGVLVFFLIFLLPAFPDDIITFIAGLTKIKISTLLLVSLIGRLPGYAILSFTGHGLILEKLDIVIIVITAMIIIMLIAFWKRKWLHRFVEHRNPIKFMRQTWKKHKKVIIVWTICLVLTLIVLSLILNNVAFI